MGVVAAYVPDLMDRSKVAAAGPVTFVTDLAGVDADVVIVDLSRVTDLSVLAHVKSPRIIGFASHVDRELMERGRAAGCAEVLPRSQFFGRIGEFDFWVR